MVSTVRTSLPFFALFFVCLDLGHGLEAHLDVLLENRLNVSEEWVSKAACLVDGVPDEFLGQLRHEALEPFDVAPGQAS